MSFKLLGLSLIELMVVITIVGLLSAISVPLFREYFIKAKISNVMPIIENIGQAAIERRAITGEFPIDLEWNGYTLTEGNNVYVPIDNIQNVRYDRRSVNGVDMVRIMVNLRNMDGLPGYVSPNTPEDNSTHGMIRYIIRDTGGVYVPYCGQWWSGNAAGEDIYVEYLPEGCGCGLEGIWLSGTGGGAC